jgi:acetyl esterase/lipase
VPDFEVVDRLSPTDPLPERETRWIHPGITLSSLTYSTLPGFRPLRLDLYRPTSGAAGNRPLVIFIHGGGWTFGNPRAGAAFKDFPSVLGALATRGYVVASIEHRLSREAAYPAPSEDLTAALAFLRGNAGRFGIDANKVALWGMSSGAHSGALEAMACAKSQPCVQGFVGWFGVYDLAAHVQGAPAESSVHALLRCEAGVCAPERLAAASPTSRVAGDEPPVLLVHGGDDTNVLPRQSIGFAQRLRSAGNPVELVLVPGVGHGLIGKDSAVTKDALQQALTATFGFFDRLLRPATAP